jgi:hypothetical protein
VLDTEGSKRGQDKGTGTTSAEDEADEARELMASLDQQLLNARRAALGDDDDDASSSDASSDS